MCVAIIADDLTGALDVCAPLAARGLRCHVATNPNGIDAALARSGDVVCVNTASREKSADEAYELIHRAARRLAASDPLIVFKKIDSRLKGHVAAETAACLEAFERQYAVVAPAIPGQGRFVRDGKVVGSGLDSPLAIADRLGSKLRFETPDTGTIEDLREVARQNWLDVLLVGASGLSEGLARILGSAERRPRVEISGPLLLAIGSHDPITLAQVERAASLTGLDYQVSPDGRLDDGAASSPVALYRADSVPGTPQHGAILARFGAAIAERLREPGIETTLLCGGETAQTVLSELGVDCVELIGEALPGIAVCRTRLQGRDLTILTKSGGFGTPDDLMLLAQAAQKTMRNTDHNRVGTIV